MQINSRARCALMSASAIGTVLGGLFVGAAPALAQSASDDTGAIIVTARRVEERLQDVPISITVLNQQQLTNNNVSSMKDLATNTPGLQINSRYGSDSTNFSIRGFTQEQRTSATVGVFFADVVAPRGSGGTFGGDGAGPGALFDLQNVQVLKGPQGTLFGRNTTGGNVLLVPKKPTSKLEGYVEGSYGDYNMYRLQGVVNLPLADTFRVRIGVDHMKRDGYLKNIGTLGDGIHPGKGMGDVDYVAVRGSAVADLTPNLENYTIFTYSKSSSNGVIPKILSCSESIPGQNFGLLTKASCQAQMTREAAYGPWTVENRLPDSASVLRQWQVINTTTWKASDSLTVKNIASYAEFRQKTNLDLFGNYYIARGVAASAVTNGGQVTGFAFTHANPFNSETNAQSSFVEEFQLQGHPEDGKLTWQAGAYMELNNPLGFSGVQTATGSSCVDINAVNCPAVPGFSLGSINMQLSKTKFTDYALYAQATYALTPKLKLTGGIRYTWDKEDADIQIETITPTVSLCQNSTAADFGPGPAALTFPTSDRLNRCHQNLVQKSHAPTWLIGIDFKPVDDVLLYAKYSRGYRAGGISLFGPDSVYPNKTNLQIYKPERIDAYEIGAKTSWHGSVPGSFNLAGFYNNFADQQLLLGAVLGVRPNALVANAGKSRIYGLEAELNVRPIPGWQFSVSYSYINSKLEAFNAPNLGAGVALTPPLVGHPIPNTEPHKLNVSGSYTLPFVPETMGKLTVGASFVFTAGYEAVAPGCPAAVYLASNGVPVNTGCYDASNNTLPYQTTAGIPTATNTGIANPGLGLVNVNPKGGRIPGYGLLNLNVNWENFAGLPLDASFFITNVTNKVYYNSINDNTSRSFRSGLLGEPRMFGGRLRYRF